MRALPAIFGYLLFVAGGAYMVMAFFVLVLPEYRQHVSSVAQLLEVADVPIIFWLVIRGAGRRRLRGDGRTGPAASYRLRV